MSFAPLLARSQEAPSGWEETEEPKTSSKAKKRRRRKTRKRREAVEADVVRGKRQASSKGTSAVVGVDLRLAH